MQESLLLFCLTAKATMGGMDRDAGRGWGKRVGAKKGEGGFVPESKLKKGTLT